MHGTAVTFDVKQHWWRFQLKIGRFFRRCAFFAMVSGQFADKAYWVKAWI